MLLTLVERSNHYHNYLYLCAPFIIKNDRAGSGLTKYATYDIFAEWSILIPRCPSDYSWLFLLLTDWSSVYGYITLQFISHTCGSSSIRFCMVLLSLRVCFSNLTAYIVAQYMALFSYSSLQWFYIVNTHKECFGSSGINKDVPGM